MSKRVDFQVEGITCVGCATDMETVLKNTDGITDAEVNYAAGAVSVEYDPVEIDVRQIVDALKSMGLKIR